MGDHIIYTIDIYIFSITLIDYLIIFLFYALSIPIAKNVEFDIITKYTQDFVVTPRNKLNIRIYKNI
jgi:tetrahydromethanopterin S-methyltransferase subunit D